MSNVVILGALSGIASAVAYKFAEEGHNLLLAGRNVDMMENMASDISIRFNVQVKALFFDAMEFTRHEEFLKNCLQFGEIKGVILCYGYLGDQKKAQLCFEEARHIIDTNYTSCVSILHLLANYFEKKQSGFICGITSVAGDRGRQSNYMYGASKGAFSIYLQGLRNRLSPYGVHVITVKPGFVDTKMTYGQEGMFLVASPQKVARDIYLGIQKSKNIIYTPFFWKWIMLIIKNIPEVVFKKMKL
ncbi:MAG: short-chain dehydrogenase [Neobacillus sp.]|jgi:short-subunit dehydrogenase|nr:short-chain dehydrogenase [Neobacillus sp.]